MTNAEFQKNPAQIPAPFKTAFSMGADFCCMTEIDTSLAILSKGQQRH